MTDTERGLRKREDERIALIKPQIRQAFAVPAHPQKSREATKAI